ncbi:hypothetical protein DFH08DRAFT_947663 [Mycena albidolilacea]|uniref:F-box domain-containing protein n=1 Tax=Mycena albidolilacea TaxID=1033008 RepID=A0AAD7F6Q9_9AGAR|nr:hypothetical protein DFH08DRAFT_947663 [Mycena albidolilacea]
MTIAAALRAQVSDLNSAISRQERILDDMRSRLQDLQSQLESIAYPILTLPPEMTSEIFIHCLPSKRYMGVVNTDEAPLLLTHVCRVWRQIAISTPALWATFDIDDMWRLPRLAEIAQTWFKLLQLNVEDFEDANTHLVESSVFTMLQKLSIEIDNNRKNSDAVVIFNNVPLLHEVIMIAVAPSFAVLPWQQLTKFTGEVYEVKECIEAIRLMPNLLECVFSAFWRDDGDANRFGTVSHPNMQHFTLSELSESTLYRPYRPFSIKILTLVTFPSLETLKISEMDNFGAEEAEALDSFLQRSSPPLRKLAVHPFEGEVELRLSPPFMALIGLVELEIWRPARNFLSSFLTGFGCDPNLLPQLQNLTLGCHIPEDEEYYMRFKDGPDFEEILRDAAEPVTKRREILPGCAQLQSFRVISEKLCVGAWYSEENLLPFRKLKESGMYVHIGTETRSVLQVSRPYNVTRMISFSMNTHRRLSL